MKKTYGVLDSVTVTSSGEHATGAVLKNQNSSLVIISLYI